MTQKTGVPTVEVPVAWLKRLVNLSKNTRVTSTTFLNSTRLDDSKLVQLQGFIESAETLYIADAAKENKK